jgi:thioredoxin 1
MESFHNIIGSKTPVLVDFYADWCGPCKAMSPAIQQVGKDVEGKARVIKVNIDKNQTAAMQYNVRAVPTFIIFKQGQPVWRHSGMIDKNTLEKQLLAFA